MTHISLAIQRDIYISKYAQSTNESERNFYMNVVLFVDSIIKNTGIDTIDCLPENKRFLSGMTRDEILKELGNPQIQELENLDVEPTSECVIVKYNGQKDVSDMDEWSLAYWFPKMKDFGYSLVACEVSGQWAFFTRAPPDDVHGVDDVRLLYRSLKL